MTSQNSPQLLVSKKCDLADLKRIRSNFHRIVMRLTAGKVLLAPIHARQRVRFNAIGVVGIAPERRGPEYLAKYVVEEIARWEGPIKAAGLQVD